MIKIKIKKHVPEMPDLKKYGDWIDLYFCGLHPKNPTYFPKWNAFDNKYVFYPGDYYLLSLGVSIKLPKGYEAHVVPRSSLFLKKGIILGNSFGVIDNDYCGDDDVWGFTAYFTRSITLELFERIAQFRIIERMPEVYLEYVDSLGNQVRGGFGSTDNK